MTNAEFVDELRAIVAKPGGDSAINPCERILLARIEELEAALALYEYPSTLPDPQDGVTEDAPDGAVRFGTNATGTVFGQAAPTTQVHLAENNCTRFFNPEPDVHYADCKCGKCVDGGLTAETPQVLANRPIDSSMCDEGPHQPYASDSVAQKGGAV